MTKNDDPSELGWLKNEIVPPVTVKTLKDDVESLCNPSNYPIHDWRRTANIFPREINEYSLFVNPNVSVTSMLKPIKHSDTDEILEWVEKINIEDGKTDDLSMKRPPLPPHLASIGNPARIPFLPSNFNDNGDKATTIDLTPSNNRFSFMGEPLLTRVSTLNIGVDFADDGYTILDENVDNSFNKDVDLIVDLENCDLSAMKSIIENEDPLMGIWSESSIVTAPETKTQVAHIENNKESNDLEQSVVETLTDMPVLAISTHQTVKKPLATEWVEIMDTSKPVVDFEKKIPNMAYTFPFELDTFQKLAILKLEEQAHVFVAAHTSAGKTVVAEYAIALSFKHCTRVIYTSPVKALSNQKYREFTKAFGDVGLITGDIQINTTASCLIMTTEILRSMLYYGADVIRDLEYVIFDEVHYINDTQRGYVWEEVLILLPSHCSIVMLSATVPNTLEFADWVGRTKKRMVYVVSTTKRPVALCHYLYTGSGGKSKDNRYLILGPENKFLMSGYNDACKSFLEKKSNNSFRGKQPYGRGNFNNPSQEKGMWIGLVDHLKRHDKLPVVVFILSRNRCDGVAESLMSLDLTTAKEKSRIHVFIQACLKKLNESDRKLPQVMNLQTLLSNGIGIHHSGILPILKEVVEMLFQFGLVKLLFATETFAVGVNMPARTVIFESITKYDGMNWRSLLPSEYIQMAGRAGRRGLDDTGTVIILCKKEVPSNTDLVTMMLGKPTKLSSQFRITYATMLSLLRVTNLSIETMMKNSFREFGVQSKTSTHKLELESLKKLINNFKKTTNSDFISCYCDSVAKYLRELADIMPVILTQKSKELTIGRVLVICYEKYAFSLAILLEFTGNRYENMKVLVLDYDNHPPPATVKNKTLWHSLLYLANCRYDNQNSTLNHKIITVKLKHIAALTSQKFKGDCFGVVNDYDTRQHSRLKKPLPPNNNCMQAIRLLYDLTFSYGVNNLKISMSELTRGLKIMNGEIMKSLSALKDNESYVSWLTAPVNQENFHNFHIEFPIVFERKELEWKSAELELSIKTEGMSLYPEYERRLQVLKDLRYIDSQNHVAIKGRVACELGKNELMITEIVFRNILTNLGPAEIAALLSCLVVEARIQNKSEQKLDKVLMDRIDEITEINNEISQLEQNYMVGIDDPMSLEPRLNFGLVEVVYEWAKGKPFSDIINLTDVQEGIIVHSIQKLHEVVMNVRDVAKIIGDPILQSKMDEASLAIKRDIVFAASLYTQDDINLHF